MKKIFKQKFTNNYFYLIFFLVFLNILFFQFLSSLDYGTAWTSEGHLSIRGGDNRFKPEAMLDNGFTMIDSSVSCTFDSLFPVIGSIFLNGSRFYLNRDMYFYDNFNLQTGGRLVGLGNKINFSKQSTVYFPEPIGEIIMTSAGSYAMSAAVNCVDWSYSDSYV